MDEIVDDALVHDERELELKGLASPVGVVGIAW
jgi:hypothetical protein